MKSILQRVSSASVIVEGTIVGQIGLGLLILLGVEEGDGPREVAEMVRKIAGIRVFNDAQGKMNLSCEALGGSYLCISQFTLCADTRKGKRPSFLSAMKPPASEHLYADFCEALAAATQRPVQRGIFGADMKVALVNDGPVTIPLEVPPLAQGLP